MRRCCSLHTIQSACLFVLALSVSFAFLRSGIVVGAQTVIVPDEYPTIQSAVNNAEVGDTIFVRNGTYFENVIVNKTLTLTGESSSSTIVDGNGTGSVFTVSARNVRIAGFTIQMSGVGVPNSGIRVLDSSWWCVFKDNNLTDNYVGIPQMFPSVARER